MSTEVVSNTTSTTDCGCTAWAYNDDGTPMEALHQYTPNRPVNHDDLKALGVLYYQMKDLDQDPKLATLRTERGYSEFDIVNITSEFPKEKLEQFFDEHLHEDEEIRLCMKGSGFFDVRSKDDSEWIRIHCHLGDLLIIPAGIYHRFTLDEKKSITAMRLFTSAPKWIALSRTIPETESLVSREEYKKFLRTTGAGYPIIITGENAPAALANYPHARSYGGLIYLSGFSSRRPDNTHRGATKLDDGTFELDVYEQTIGVIENMKNVLQARGGDLCHLLDITVFLTDMKHFKRYNEAYNQYFNAQSGPSRTTVAVKELPHPNLLIEIKGVAAEHLD